MAKAYITPEEGAKLRQLHAECVEAERRVAIAIGISTEAFTEADVKLGRIMWQIREIHGTADKHWMAQ